MSKYTNTYMYRHYKFFQQGKETFEYISACLPSKICKIFVFLSKVKLFLCSPQACLITPRLPRSGTCWWYSLFLTAKSKIHELVQNFSKKFFCSWQFSVCSLCIHLLGIQPRYFKSKNSQEYKRFRIRIRIETYADPQH